MMLALCRDFNVIRNNVESYQFIFAHLPEIDIYIYIYICFVEYSFLTDSSNES